MKRSNVAQPKAKKYDPLEHVERHRDGFVDAAMQVTGLVNRMTKGKLVLGRMAMDHPDRPARERLWQDLATRLHDALRNAYGRYALIRIAVGHADAQAMWDACMPSREQMDLIGVGDFVRYWRGRTEPPAWVTKEETSLIRRVEWPPEGCYPDNDVINQKLADFYSEPPF